MNYKLLHIAAIMTIVAFPATCQDLVAVKAKTIHTISGPSIADGVILIENGRITKIAKASDVEIPWAAKVIDEYSRMRRALNRSHTSAGG